MSAQRSGRTTGPTSLLILGLATAGVVTPCAGALAQAVETPELIVTATRVETPLDQTTNSVTVIKADEIERHQQRTVVDVLRTVPGLSVVQSGPVGNQTSVFIRGANANQTLVLIDGMRANDPSTTNGAFNFAHLLTDNIDRIEVVRGPLSTLYGSDAIGGVINIITRKGAGGPTVTASVEAGSFHTYLGHAGIEGAQGRFNYNVSLVHLDTDSVSSTPARRRGGRDDESDPYRNTTFSSRLGAAIAANAEVSLFTRYIGTEKAIDGVPEDPNTRERADQWFNRLVGTVDLFDGTWTQTFGAGFVQIDRRDTDAPDAYAATSSRTVNKGTRTKFDWQNDIRPTDNLVVTIGAETEEERFQGELVDDAHARTSGIFLQNSLTAWDRVYLTLGARIDDHDQFGTFDTYRVSAAYLHRETGTKLKAGIGSGFKAPTLFQLFGHNTFFTGNPDLRPEESVGWEIGVEQSFAEKRVTIGTTYFHNDIKNLIMSDPAFTTNINVGKAVTSGFESFLELRPFAQLTIRVDHTYLRAEDASDGTQLVRRPKHKLGVLADYTPRPEWTVGLGIVYDGTRADFDADSFARIYPGGYTVVRLTSSYALDDTWTLFGRVENALDRRYEEPDGFNQPGIGAFAGVRAQF